MIMTISEPSKLYSPLVWRPENSTHASRHVACEVPIVIEYNCVSHAVMMTSPHHLTDFVLGFSLTEGVIDSPSDVLDITINKGDKGYVATLEISPKCFVRLDKFKRVLTGRTGCGLCGHDRLDHAIRPLNKIVSDLAVSAQVIHDSMQRLADLQILNKKTGALHAAAFVTAQGKILSVREDIGRHNALDKLIGYMMQEKINPAQGFALITSRCSFEMVHKCAVFGIPVLAAISATTDLALTLAEEAGLSLIAFARRDGMNIYTDPAQRIIFQDTPLTVPVPQVPLEFSPA